MNKNKWRNLLKSLSFDTYVPYHRYVHWHSAIYWWRRRSYFSTLYFVCSWDSYQWNLSDITRVTNNFSKFCSFQPACSEFWLDRNSETHNGFTHWIVRFGTRIPLWIQRTDEMATPSIGNAACVLSSAMSNEQQIWEVMKKVRAKRAQLVRVCVRIRTFLRHFEMGRRTQWRAICRKIVHQIWMDRMDASYRQHFVARHWIRRC